MAQQSINLYFTDNLLIYQIYLNNLSVFNDEKVSERLYRTYYDKLYF